MASSRKASRGHLPTTIDPVQLAERGARLSGTLSLKAMPRLAQVCSDATGDVIVDLAFERSEAERVPVMYGTLRACLRVTCQRCLEDMDLELNASPWLILLKSAAGHDSLEQEPDILVADKPVSLNALVEDELLLVLPMVCLHELSRCPARAHMAGETSVIPDATEAGIKKPFSVLSKLKHTK
ncbi:MAG: YceD family protein [Sulfuricaulis sp.]